MYCGGFEGSRTWPTARAETVERQRGFLLNLAYVNIFVGDLDRAVDFYEGTLGLVRVSYEQEHGYAAFRAGAISLGLAVAEPRQDELVGRHTGVGLAVADLEAEHARLTALGVTFSLPPTRQPWGGFMAMFADPDGNIFYLDEVAVMHSA